MKIKILLFTLFTCIFALHTMAQEVISITDAVVAEVSEAEPDTDMDDADLKVQSTEGASFRSFMMFDLSSLSGEVNSAAIQLYMAQHEDASGEGLQTPYRVVFLPVDDVSWDGTLTWNQAETNGLIDSEKFSLADVNVEDYNSQNDSKWYYVSNALITNYINEKIAAGESKAAFAVLALDSVASHDVWIGNWSNKVPTLMVQQEGTAPTVLETANVAEVFEANPDASGEDNVADLKIQSTTDGNDKIALLKYDLSEVSDPVSNAAIQVYGSQHNGDLDALDEYMIEVYEAKSTNWDNTLTYNQYSAFGEQSIGTALFDMFAPEANHPVIKRGNKSKIISGVKLTELINSYIEDGETEIAFVLKAGTQNDEFNAWIGGTWKSPKLYLEHGEAPVTLEGTNDGEVDSSDPDAVNPDGNGGDLRIQTADDKVIRSYVKFDISDLNAEEVKYVTLQVYGAQHEAEGNVPERYLIDLWGVEDVDEIDNTSLTYNISETFTLTEKTLGRIDLPAESEANNKIWKYNDFTQKALTDYIIEKLVAGETEVGFAFIANETINSHNAYIGGTSWKGPELKVYGKGYIMKEEKEQVEKPVITPTVAEITVGEEIEMSVETTGATIYYSTDGSDPDASTGTEYTGPITTTEDMIGELIIKAIAVAEDMTDSEITSALFIISEQPVPVTGVSLDITSLELDQDESQTLTAIIEPENATDKTVTWSSSNNDVVTVNQDGVVSFAGAGSSTVTVTTNQGGFTAECSVTTTVDVTGISLDITSLELGVDETRQLTATVTPEDATNQSVSWSSSDNEVVTVDEIGLVSYVGSGSAVITVTTEEGNFTAECQVNALVSINNPTLSSFKSKIYPNPVNDILNFEIISESAFEVRISIMDISGKKYFEDEINIIRGNNIKCFKVDHLKEGIYFISLKNKELKVVKMFMVE